MLYIQAHIHTGTHTYKRRQATPKAYTEGLQEGEVPREGGREGIAENAAARALSEAKAYAEGRRLAGGRSPEGGGGEQGKRVGESIPDGWRPEASPPAGLCLCLCLSLLQTLSHTQKYGETETV